MRRTGGGSIVNVASVHRLISEPNSGAYAASKGAVAQLTRNLAIEFAPYNIVVNSISPGFVRTAMSIVNGVDETTKLKISITPMWARAAFRFAVPDARRRWQRPCCFSPGGNAPTSPEPPWPWLTV